jgi:hypothetical protein
MRIMGWVVAATVLWTPMLGAQQRDSASPPDRGARRMVMQDRMQQQMRMMDSMNARMDSMVARMNQATGNMKMTRMAQVITEMVAQRKAMHQQMRQMMESRRSMMDSGDMMMNSGQDSGSGRVAQPQTRRDTTAADTGHAAHHPKE